MIIDKNLLDSVRNEAQASPRLRMNYNFHESPDSAAQRMLNSLLPGTEIPVHRHRHTAETYIILDGQLKIHFYDNDGNITDTFNLLPTCTAISGLLPSEGCGIHIPAGQWHGLEVVLPSTIFEVKDGPYTPLTPDDILII